ncbi:ATP-dependent Clp protease ATP-binding subunit [Candidatus Wolfebacteria bacterium]|nr:ATP-dependent Clp protease ATP-binding subunit [Candidatus Wolfebacteria bacterium]
MSKIERSFKFEDSRFEMSHFGRFFVRLVFYSTYGLLIAACLTFLLSDVLWIFWSGVFLLLVSLDRIKHFTQANKSLYKKIEGDINLADYTTPVSSVIIEYAFERALVTGGNFYLFLLKRLVEKKNIKEGLVRMDLNPNEVQEKIEEELHKSLGSQKYNNKKEQKNKLLSEIEKILKLAFDQALKEGDRFIDPKDLFAALSYCDSDGVLKVLRFFNIDAEDLEHALIFGRYRYKFWFIRLPATLGGFVHKPYKIRHRIMNRAWTSRPTPTLDKFSVDLTDLARSEKIGFLVGHDEEYDRMEDVLSRQNKPNVLLSGDPGAGKETLVAHLAYKIIKDEVPLELFDRRLVMLQIGSLVSGAEQSELQDRINNIIEEIIKAGNIILYIPDIHNLTKASNRKTGLSAADILLPAISSSSFSVIGATNPMEYKSSIERHAEFSKAFELIRVQEVSLEEAIKILVYDAIILEKQYRTKVTFGAVKQSVILASKYFRDTLLPSSAEGLLKEALADAKDKGDKVLSSDDIIDIAQRRVNIPLRQAKDDEAKKLLNLESLIHEKLVDQEEAVKSVSQALREYRSGLSKKGGPMASFLFVGPTGVGKTELSKILAELQFGSKQNMIRFDMSEYQTKQSIARFIGSPDGSFGGALTDSIIQKPYSLVLLDEFEKAHPDILNLFLQVLDDGRLTDSLGNVADFQNAIIIATSNAHSDYIKKSIDSGKKMAEISDELKKKMAEYFRPELINRFSEIIVFKGLSSEDIVAIARIMLDGMINDIKSSHHIEVSFSDAAIKKIAEWGYEPAFGARPLKGVISDKVRSVLAKKVLANEISRGHKVDIDIEGDDLTFKIN